MGNIVSHEVLKKQYAASLLAQKREQKAREILLELSVTAECDPEVWSLLGAASSMMALHEEAERCMRRVLKLSRNNARAYANLGSALRAQKKCSEALAAFERAVRIQPDYALAHYNLGGVLEDLGRDATAIKSYRRAVKLAPNTQEFHYSLAEALNKSGRTDKALVYYQKVLELKPDNADAVTRIAEIHKIEGRYNEAFAVLRGYMSTSGERKVELALHAARLYKYVGRFDEGIALLENIRANAQGLFDRANEISISFTLGSLYDAQGDYEKAFANYTKGNHLSAVPNKDVEIHEEGLRASLQVFTPEFLVRAPRAGNNCDTPVFIVGMPRSGTTLVEQILCSHPLVYGAGELPYLREEGDRLHALAGSEEPYPTCLKMVESTHLERAANDYLSRTRRLVTAEVKRVTDKMPGNYWNLGLIWLLFPKARIIHCARDPLDTCLSIYFQNFANGHWYSNDLESIAKIYNVYSAVMKHWRSVLDCPVLEVRYEEMVSDQEGMSRRMVDFCGLEWDESCLAFYRNRRAALTASQDQVRKPIYTNSRYRWKNYERFIDPLVTALNCS